jgi:hypothetical protein
MLSNNFINIHSNIIHLVKIEVQLIEQAYLAHTKMCSLPASIDKTSKEIHRLHYQGESMLSRKLPYIYVLIISVNNTIVDTEFRLQKIIVISF